MQIAVCVDDNMGMLFNKRRQSRDQVVVNDILNQTGKVRIHPFSKSLFEENIEKVLIEEDFLQQAQSNELCFVENANLQPYLDRIEKIILYRWNRRYPSDLRLDVNLNLWERVEQVDMIGKSHEKITREIYIRRK